MKHYVSNISLYKTKYIPYYQKM